LRRKPQHATLWNVLTTQFFIRVKTPPSRAGARGLAGAAIDTDRRRCSGATFAGACGRTPKQLRKKPGSVMAIWIDLSFQLVDE